jgi:hypothetical protein
VSYQIRDGNGQLKTVFAGQIQGEISPFVQLVDLYGNPLGISSNPLVIAPISINPPTPLTALGYQQITNLSGPNYLTVPEGTIIAIIRVEGGSARYRDDGPSPTDMIGMPINSTDAPLSYSGNFAALQFIQQSSGVILNALYYS